MYECCLCHDPIETHQLRHSDGLGHYHLVCEFNAIRERLGLPLYQEVRKVKYYSGFETAPMVKSMSKIDWKTTNKKQVKYEFEIDSI